MGAVFAGDEAQPDGSTDSSVRVPSTPPGPSHAHTLQLHAMGARLAWEVNMDLSPDSYTDSSAFGLAWNLTQNQEVSRHAKENRRAEATDP